MSLNNRYVKRSKISEAKFRLLVRYFAADLQATQIALLSGLNRNTVNRYLKAIRERIAENCELDSPLSGELDIAESSLDACVAEDEMVAGSGDNNIVFGITKRQEKVYTKIMPECAKSHYNNIINGFRSPGSLASCDALSDWDVLVDVGYGKCCRIDHGNDDIAQGSSQIKAIEGFWGLVKTRLAKFRGMSKSTFYLHLKESEFRYNYRNQNLYLITLKLLRNNPLS